MKQTSEHVDALQTRSNLANCGEFADLRADRRSVHAMLARRDDDRVVLYELFCLASGTADLFAEQESITAAYHSFELNACVNTRHLPKRWHEAATRHVMRLKLYAMLGKRLRWPADACFWPR